MTTQTRSQESYVGVTDSGHVSSYVGPDAVLLATAISLRAALKLWIQTGMLPTRQVTIRRMLDLTTRQFTGRPYSRGTAAAQLAVDDLTVWIESMRLAIPVVPT